MNKDKINTILCNLVRKAGLDEEVIVGNDPFLESDCQIRGNSLFVFSAKTPYKATDVAEITYRPSDCRGRKGYVKLLFKNGDWLKLSSFEQTIASMKWGHKEIEIDGACRILNAYETYLSLKDEGALDSEYVVDREGTLQMCNYDLKTDGILRIPEGVESIAPNLFEGISTIKRVEFPSSLNSVCEEAFFNCDKLQSVYFPPDVSVEEIFPRAFSCCTSLEVVVWPEAINRIHEEAFAYTELNEMGAVCTQICKNAFYRTPMEVRNG